MLLHVVVIILSGKLCHDHALRANKLLNAELPRTVIIGKVQPRCFPEHDVRHGFGTRLPAVDIELRVHARSATVVQ
jgi:hypothetical protein